MLIIDRYVLRLFLRVVAVCFISLTGLYVIVDMFGNLDEFLSYGESQGSLLGVLYDYYGARVLTFFDRTSGLLALIAAMFAVTWMQRTNELTALLAAGISKGRILKPVVAAAAVLALLAVMNREFLIPKVRDKLTRNAQDWLGEKQKPLQPQYDYKTDIVISGRHTVASETQIVEPYFRLDTQLGDFGTQLKAKQATYRPAESDRPHGYLLDGVHQPDDLGNVASAWLNGKPVILSPSDTPWLETDQCFVVTDLTFEQLAAGKAWREFSSTGELIAGLRNPSFEYPADVRVTVHARIVQPFLDMTLLFLGLPLVLTREQRNIFVAAGLCLLIVAVFFVGVLACHALGTNYLDPALAAWCPLMIFVPTAVAMSQPFRE